MQEQKNLGITIEEAAETLNVSTATIRNWIKSKDVKLSQGKLIDYKSLLSFKENSIGKEKLTKRANKSSKDNHDHYELVKYINKSIDKGKLDPESISDLYEGRLSDSYKNKEGIYYTPKKIAESFFRYLPSDRSSLSFCDPCCGTGNFLLAALKLGFKPENIYGFDIDKTAIKIARSRLNHIKGGKNVNLLCLNFLEEIESESIGTFDVIYTNPPWGKKIDKKTKDNLSNLLHTKKSKDTSALFFFAGLRKLSNNGYLGFLLQDAFFNIATYEHARKHALQFTIRAMIDFGRPFKGLMTKANGIVLQKKPAQRNYNFETISNDNHELKEINYFVNNPKSIFNFNCTQEELATIKHLYSINHLTLEKSATYGLGIVTGNNKRFCIISPQEGYIPVYKGSDIQNGSLKKPSTFIPNDFSLYQQVAPIDLYRSKEKLIYKFISSKLSFYYDNEQKFILNSANMLVLDENFPINHIQLCHLLNSRVMNWLFQKLFNTHKVLRSDLNLLPIFYEYYRKNEVFSEKKFLEYLNLEESECGTFRIKK